jgi:hypothetical protein
VNRLRLKPRNVCGKKRHYDPDEAERHRRAVEAADRAAGRLDGHVITYWCDACSAFHIGHRNKRGGNP